MCTHLAAFRTAANIRKRGVAHVMKAPLGYFDSNASGLIRGRLDAAAADTETLLAHNLADIVGTIVLFIAMLVLMFVFDWRMGAACVLAAVISVIAMFSMMGGKNAKIMAEYQAALDRISKAGTEYVRGIPVVEDLPADGVFLQGVQRSHRGIQRQGGILAVGRLPRAAVRQPDVYRRRVYLSGPRSPVPRARGAGRRRLCRVRDQLRLLRGVLRHHLHGADSRALRSQRPA